MDIKILSTASLLDCGLFEVKRSTVEEKGVRYTRDVVEHPGSAVVVPYFENGSIGLVRQYRHPAGRYLLELPAGSIDPGESALDCAGRELAEEIGVRAGSMTEIVKFYVSPGFLSETMTVFLATGLMESPAEGDEDEILEVERMPIGDALEMALSNGFSDAKTMLGIIYADKALKAAQDTPISA